MKLKDLLIESVEESELTKLLKLMFFTEVVSGQIEKQPISTTLKESDFHYKITEKKIIDAFDKIDSSCLCLKTSRIFKSFEDDIIDYRGKLVIENNKRKLFQNIIDDIYQFCKSLKNEVNNDIQDLNERLTKQKNKQRFQRKIDSVNQTRGCYIKLMTGIAVIFVSSRVQKKLDVISGDEQFAYGGIPDKLSNKNNWIPDEIMELDKFNESDYPADPDEQVFVE